MEDFIRGIVHWTPFWSLLIYLFKYYWKKSEEAQKKAEDRLVSIETTQKIILERLHSIQPAMLEEMVRTQKAQQAEIQGLWEITKHLKRLRIHDITP